MLTHLSSCGGGGALIIDITDEKPDSLRNSLEETEIKEYPNDGEKFAAAVSRGSPDPLKNTLAAMDVVGRAREDVVLSDSMAFLLKVRRSRSHSHLFEEIAEMLAN